MITFQEALKKVLEHPLDLGVETIPLENSVGRILAEPIKADRDFPPFNRATKDGIAIQYAALSQGLEKFKIEGVASAGMPQQELKDPLSCLEVMTGAVVPKNTDTVIMYEHLEISDGYVTLKKNVVKGQNIHYKGSDEVKGALLLDEGVKISPAEIGVLATVGKPEVRIKKAPKVCAIATGNELVDINTEPKPHQIRKSNSVTLQAALQVLGIHAASLHMLDDKKSIASGLENALATNDVLLLSGGVSKGKYDFIPEVMEALGVDKIFHRVAQRPGKPFWFGVHPKHNTVIFSFPGNPVSTFANYHLYFLPWLHKSWGITFEFSSAKLNFDITINPPLTRFIQVQTEIKDATLWASLVTENGSGDLTSLAKADGFICLEPKQEAYLKGDVVRFVSIR